VDLTPLQDLFNHQGPFLTIHAEVGRGTEDAGQQIDARWTNIRRQLEEAGVGGDLVADLEAKLRDNRHVAGEARMTLVAADGKVVFEDVQAGHSIAPETTELAPLPDLSGWLQQADARVPFVLVVADREGADIDVYRALSDPDHEHREVSGETFHITKVPQGDWAQKQFQQSAENQWKRNAEEVADEVRSIARSHRPALVVLAGEERARSEVAAALDGIQTDVVQVEAGGRAAGSSEEALWAEVRTVLARVLADQQAAVAERLLERSGQGSGAVRGVDEVLDALVQGQVERLVLDLGAARDKRVRPADHPGLTLPESARTAESVPADRLLVAAGAATGADISLLPTAATKGAGVAALLRWDK
jgi:hypothetical protein